MSNAVLIDTNLLVYAHNKEAPQHAKAQQIIQQLIEKENSAISWQNLLEFYNVVTDTKKVEKPLTPKQAAKIITDYQQSGLSLIYPSEESYKQAIKLARTLRLRGKQLIFDVLLVTTMQEWKIDTIYTNDVSHFDIFEQIKTINPLK